MKDIQEFGKYTPWLGRKTFKEEKEMVKIAVEDEDESQIRNYLKPLARHWTKAFKKSQPQLKLNDDELIEAGFKHLNFGLGQYYKQLETGNVGFKFSTYFEWFIRQGIVEYLQSITRGPID